MSGLSVAVDEYLTVRRALGFKLAKDAKTKLRSAGID